MAVNERRPNVSYWVQSEKISRYPVLERDLEVDVAIIGAGIVGITAATLLKRAGKRVVVVEMDGVGRGVTGYTTAKVTSGHNLIYGRLERDHGKDAARDYASANEAGLEHILRSVADENIDCDIEHKTNYVYCEDPEDAEAIEKEVETAKRTGLPVSLVTETSLPYPIAAAIRYDRQAQFHPVKYLAHFARQIPGDGSDLFERTRVTGVGEGDPCEVRTAGGTIRSEQVIVATNYPFLDRGLLFPRIHPQRSYAVAAPIKSSDAPDGMFITSTEPTRSIRTIPDGNRTLLLVGGEGHNVGHDYDTRGRYAALERWTTERFGIDNFKYRWSAQDGVSVDGLPFVGTYRRGATRVFIATAFANGEWRMARPPP
ncbi:MAG: NAD(P)/FAD-dependent oxidoreductase [Actinomycetota bacterium]